MTSLQEIENFLDIEIGDKRLRPGKKNPNKNKYYYYPDKYYIVMLTRGMWMIAEDCKKTRRLLRLHIWYISTNGYVTTRVNQTTKSWHQRYLKYEKGLVVDHINNKKFDNQHENLRITTYSNNNRNRVLNKRNTSGKQGVCRCTTKTNGNTFAYWRASICIDGGKRSRKDFSVKKLGDVEAKRQATKWRRQKETEFGYLGD